MTTKQWFRWHIVERLWRIYRLLGILFFALSSDLENIFKKKKKEVDL